MVVHPVVHLQPTTSTIRNLTYSHHTTAPTLPPVTTPTTPTLPTPTLPPVVSPPRSAQLDSDSAQRQYLCDTAGASFYYAESLDVAARTRSIVTHSCPNHFALCQSSQCGGELKTRALITEQVVVIPLYPTISRTAPIDTTCSDRMLGVALNGVGLYGVSDGRTRECVDLLDETATGNCLCFLPTLPNMLMHVMVLLTLNVFEIRRSPHV